MQPPWIDLATDVLGYGLLLGSFSRRWHKPRDGLRKTKKGLRSLIDLRKDLNKNKKGELRRFWNSKFGIEVIRESWMDVDGKN